MAALQVMRAVDTATGLVLLAAGLMSVRRAPGWLLLAAGLAWFACSWLLRMMVAAEARAVRCKSDAGAREVPMKSSALCGASAGAVEDAGGGAAVQVQGGADVACPAMAGTSVAWSFQVNRAVVHSTCRRLCQIHGPLPPGVAPAGQVVGGCQDAAVEVGGPPEYWHAA